MAELVLDVYEATGGQSVTANVTPYTYDTEVVNTDSAYSAGVWTCPEDGVYFMCWSIFHLTNAHSQGIYVNGSNSPTASPAGYGRIGDREWSGCCFQATLSLSQDDTVECRATNTKSMGTVDVANPKRHWWKIVKLTDAATLVVDARRTASGTVASQANYVMDTATVNEGTAYNTTTGVFTAQSSGVYMFCFTGRHTSPNTNQTYCSIKLNGSEEARLCVEAGGLGGQGTWVADLSTNDTVEFFHDNNNLATWVVDNHNHLQVVQL